MKCPQLSKPKATTARTTTSTTNLNSIGDRTGKKKLGRQQAQSGGGQFSSGQEIIVHLLFTYCFNKKLKCINVLYFYFYIVAISNTNSIM